MKRRDFIKNVATAFAEQEALDWQRYGNLLVRPFEIECGGAEHGNRIFSREFISLPAAGIRLHDAVVGVISRDPVVTHPVEFQLERDDSTPVLHFTVAPHWGSMRWYAIPGNEIVFPRSPIAVAARSLFGQSGVMKIGGALLATEIAT